MLAADGNLIYSLNHKLGHFAPHKLEQHYLDAISQASVDPAAVQSNEMENKTEFTLLLQLEAN